MNGETRVLEINGDLYKLGVFSGDGAQYDILRRPQDPVRLGSCLLTLLTPAEQVTVMTRNPQVANMTQGVRTIKPPYFAR